MTAGPYAIGSDHCPGLSKLAEEAGEVVQVIGKIMGAGGMVKHWDGSDLRERLIEEVADVIAASRFVIKANSLNVDEVYARATKKLETFRRWHAEQLPEDPYKERRAANAVYVPGREQFVRDLVSVEDCVLCGKHISHHFTDGRPTYFCEQKT